jgi:hypothetical protein
MRSQLMLWGAGALGAAAVLGLTGNYFTAKLEELTPALAPLAIIWSVLVVMGRLPRRLI